MITRAVDKKSLRQSQDFTSYSFGIKESGLAHIFNVLRNQLYSDKILAVVREYSANALDAHVEVGKQDTPIQIVLPTKLNLNFEVRDFGRGLTEKEISEIYAMYGESTKRGTNEQIGQLGLGSKSGFAYGDNFVITSWVNGKKVVYNAFLDPSKIGRISKMEESKSQEPCGIKITVPVKNEDTDAFREKAFGLFERFTVIPKIKGVTDSELKVHFDPKKILVEGDDKSWQIVSNQQHSSNESFAVMGNIAYPIEKYSLDFVGTDDGSQLLNCAAMNIHFPIGELDVAASRESLQYNDFTKNIIKHKLKEIIKELPKILSKQFNNCKTMWEAKELYDATFSHGGFASALKDIIKEDSVKWNGVSVEHNQFDFGMCAWAKDVYGFSSHVYGKPSWFARYGNGKGVRVKREERKKILVQHSKDILVVEDDLHLDRGQFNKIAPLLEDYETRPDDMPKYEAVYLVDFGSQKDKIIEKLNFDPDMKKLSELTHVKLTEIYPRTASHNIGSRGVAADRKKHQSVEFVYDMTCDKSRQHTQRSAWFKAEAIDIDSVKDGIYVELDRFYLNFDKNNREAHPSTLQEMLPHLQKVAGIKLPIIYGFKKKFVHKVENKKNWTPLSEWLHEQLYKFLKNNKYNQILKDSRSLQEYTGYAKGHDLELHNVFERQYHRNSGDRDLKIDKLEGVRRVKDIVAQDSLMKQYLTAYNEMKPTKFELETLESIRKLVTVETNSYHHSPRLDLQIDTKDEQGNNAKPTHDLFVLDKKVRDLYPLLTSLEWRIWNQSDTEILWDKIIEYINLVDVTVVSKNKV